MQIAERVKMLCDENKITGVELGKKLGLSKSPLTDWKNGKAKPTVEQITAMCDIFAKSADFLIFGAERDRSAWSAIVRDNGVVNGVNGTNNGRIVIRNERGGERVISVEADELLRLYEGLDVRRRIELLQKGFALENEIKKLKGENENE